MADDTTHVDDHEHPSHDTTFMKVFGILCVCTLASFGADFLPNFDVSDGVVAVVDLNKMEVLRVEDHGVVPLPPESGNWTRNHFKETRTGLKPLEITQGEGPSFDVDGHEIRWQKWRFRIE